MDRLTTGSYTQTHGSLTGRAMGTSHPDDARTVSELSQTDALIAPFVTADRFMRRAPYGDFDGASASAINASPTAMYMGPVRGVTPSGGKPDPCASSPQQRAAK